MNDPTLKKNNMSGKTMFATFLYIETRNILIRLCILRNVRFCSIIAVPLINFNLLFI